MTDKQITEYEYCKNYLAELLDWRDRLPFAIQNFGCGSGQPSVEFELEDIHRQMFVDVRTSIDKSIKEVEKMITKV